MRSRSSRWGSRGLTRRCSRTSSTTNPRWSWSRRSPPRSGGLLAERGRGADGNAAGQPLGERPLSIPLSGTATTLDAGSSRSGVARVAQLRHDGRRSDHQPGRGASQRRRLRLPHHAVDRDLGSRSDDVLRRPHRRLAGHVGPGQSTTVTVAFSPTASGSRLGTNGGHPHRHQHTALDPVVGRGRRICVPRRALPGQRRRSAGVGIAELVRGLCGVAVSLRERGRNRQRGGELGRHRGPVAPLGAGGDTHADLQSERNDLPASPDLTYSLPVPSGTPVEVRLYLAEMYGGCPGRGRPGLRRQGRRSACVP